MKKNLFVLLLSSVFCLPSFSKIIDQVEAVVLKRPILTSDLTRFKKNLERGVLVEQAIAQVFELESLKTDKQTQINYFKYLEIFKNHFSKDLRGKVSDDEITQKINSIAGRSNLSLEEFKVQLARENIDYEDYREFLKNSLQVSRVIGVEISPRVKVNDQDVLQKLKTGATLVPSFRYKLSHIIVKGSQGDALKTRSQAIAKGWQSVSLNAKVKVNAPFGNFNQGDLMDDFQAALDEVDSSGVTQPIAVEDKYYILKIEEKSKIKALPNTPEIMKLKAELRQKYMLDNIRSWLKRKSSDLKV